MYSNSESDLQFCYLFGYYQFSFGWIFILVTLHVLKSHMWRQREKRLLGLRQAALKEREVGLVSVVKIIFVC